MKLLLRQTFYYKFSYYNFHNVKFFHLTWNVTLRNWVFHMFLLNVKSHLLSYTVSHYRRRNRRFSLWSFSIRTLKGYPTRMILNSQLYTPLRNSAYISLFQSGRLERGWHSFYKIVRVYSPYIHIWTYGTFSCAQRYFSWIKPGSWSLWPYCRYFRYYPCWWQWNTSVSITIRVYKTTALFFHKLSFSNFQGDGLTIFIYFICWNTFNKIWILCYLTSCLNRMGLSSFVF